MKKLFCKIRWHCFLPFFTSHWIFLENDGASDHYRCSWCGYEGMIDSQGNLF